MIQHKLIVLKSDKEKSLLRRHPWLFSGAIAWRDKTMQPGDLVEVQSAGKATLAFGFWESEHSISAKLFSFNATLPEIGKLLISRVENAIALRTRVFKGNSKTNAFRLIHAEGDGLPGLIADKYNNCIVIQWLSAGLIPFQDLIKQAIALDNNYQFVDRGLITSQSAEMPSAQFLENGISFEADLVNGQKTGFFLDQRDNRAYLGSWSKGKRILNTFSFSGGFSLYAAKGGASEVWSVDISKEAIRQAYRNFELNPELDGNHKGIASDCFEFLREDSGEWDVIVVDPPAFAKNAHSVDKAARGYKDLNLQAIKRLKSEGGMLLTFSCSQHISPDLFRKIIFAAALDAGREAKVLGILSQGADHPTSVYHPEGEYLKGLALWVE